MEVFQIMYLVGVVLCLIGFVWTVLPRDPPFVAVVAGLLGVILFATSMYGLHRMGRALYNECKIECNAQGMPVVRANLSEDSCTCGIGFTLNRPQR